MVQVVLFDLDNTLAHTADLEDIRKYGRYDELNEERLKGIRPYPKCKGIIEALLSNGVRLGVVTNSGRRYAEILLEHLGIKDAFEVVVTYTDVGAEGMKPSPMGIRLALEKLGVPASERVLYIGDDYVDIVASYKAGVLPIVPSWATRTPVSQMPAAVLSTEHLIDDIHSPENIKLIAERCAEANSFEIEKKWLYFAPLDLSSNVVTLKEQLQVLCLGRYFSQKSRVTAAMHDGHELSQHIFEKELNPEFEAPEYWVDLLTHCAEKIPEYMKEVSEGFDIVTVIPAKQEKPKRLEMMLRRMRQKTNMPALFVEDVFEFSPGAVSLKSVSADSRFATVSDSLHLSGKCTEDVSGKKILIIDDVVTTGSTFARAFELLENAGAALVVGLTLAKTVSIAEDNKPCVKCGRMMRLQKNKTDGGRFWGCTGFKDALSPCKHTEPMEVKECPKCGRSMFMKRNSHTGQQFISCEGWKMNPRCNYSENVS
ncbi:TPA: HAD-IA family hydrolase [Pseudomonas aeruginosa]